MRPCMRSHKDADELLQVEVIGQLSGSRSGELNLGHLFEGLCLRNHLLGPRCWALSLGLHLVQQSAAEMWSFLHSEAGLLEEHSELACCGTLPSQ